MAIVSNCKCSHPSLVYNKYTGQPVFKSCGKCISCQRARQSAWTAKMQRESSCHLYEFMVNLDYNERSLPKYDFSDHGEYLIEITPRLDKYYKKFPHLKTVYFNDLQFDSDADRHYFIDRLNSHHTCIPHASVYDIQLFKKRLNTYIKREITGKYSNFRSVFVTELGGDTFRPHVHGALWFDDERIAKNLQKLVNKAWRDSNGRKLGHSTVEPSRGKLTSYLAKYLVKPTNLPSFYAHPALNTFILSSRHPPIGMLFESKTQIRDIFDSASPITVKFQKSGDLWAPKIVPIGQNIENRLFPKCLSYSSLSNIDRSQLYKIAHIDGQLVPSYKLWLKLISRYCLDGDRQEVNRRFSKLKYFDRLQLGLETKLLHFKDCNISYILKCVTRNFETERSLRTLYSVSSRVYWQSEVFNVDVDYYISRILKFHNVNKPKSVFRKFYQTQNEILKRYPDYETKYFYPLTHFKDGYDPSKAPDAIVYQKDVQQKHAESLKNKQASEYRDKKLKFNDPVLCNLLNNYYAEKCNENAEALSHTG